MKIINKTKPGPHIFEDVQIGQVFSGPSGRLYLKVTGASGHNVVDLTTNEISIWSQNASIVDCFDSSLILNDKV